MLPEGFGFNYFITATGLGVGTLLLLFVRKVFRPWLNLVMQNQVGFYSIIFTAPIFSSLCFVCPFFVLSWFFCTPLNLYNE